LCGCRAGPDYGCRIEKGDFRVVAVHNFAAKQHEQASGTTDVDVSEIIVRPTAQS
jgi:hypothetical protein